MLWTANRTILFDLHIFHTINDWSQSASLKGLSRWWRTATNKEKWSLLPFWQQAGQKSTIETKIGIWTGNTKICWKKTPTIYKWMKKQCTDAKPKNKAKILRKLLEKIWKFRHGLHRKYFGIEKICLLKNESFFGFMTNPTFRNDFFHIDDYDSLSYVQNPLLKLNVNQ